MIPSSESVKIWYFLLAEYFYLRIESPRGRKEDQNTAKSLLTGRLNGERKYTLKTIYLPFAYSSYVSGKLHIWEHLMRMKFQEDLILPGCYFSFNELKCNVRMSLYYFLSISAKNSSSPKCTISYSMEACVTQVPASERDLSDKVT